MTRNRRMLGILGPLLLASALGSAAAFAQSAPPPISYQVLQQLQSNPEALHELLTRPVAPIQPPAPSGPISASPGTWTAVTNNPGISLTNPLLMPDGTVIVHDASGTDWWKLTPDSSGNYTSGTWSKFASLPASLTYGPLYFASQVLPDGRIEINGGEYNFGTAVLTSACRTNPTPCTKGAIYYPSFGAWTGVAPPPGWHFIGDASSVVLDDGTYMLFDCCDNPPLEALFDPTPPFTAADWTATGSGKHDYQDEEGWTKLPNGNVLTVDIFSCDMNSEIYNAGIGTWSSAGPTPAELSTCSGSLAAFEMGPVPLRPDGTVFAFGGVNEGTDPTAIFNSTLGTWAAGPSVPSVSGVPYTLADAPAAVEPNGNVLFAASPSNWATNTSYPQPTHFFEVSPANVIAQVADTLSAASSSSYYYNFLVLPNGQILETDFLSTAEVYTPLGSPNPAWAPVIDTSPTDVTRAYTYQLAGTQFNGLTQGAFYGDDVQAATNYPIVKIVNMGTGDVFYERTSNWSTTSVAPGISSTTDFTVLGVTETGPSILYVIANGISSTGVLVTVH
jgi:hypothetical protein